MSTDEFKIGEVYIHIRFDEPYVIDGLNAGGVAGRLQLNGKWKSWGLEGARPSYWLRPIGKNEQRTILEPPPLPLSNEQT